MPPDARRVCSINEVYLSLCHSPETSPCSSALLRLLENLDHPCTHLLVFFHWYRIMVPHIPLHDLAFPLPNLIVIVHQRLTCPKPLILLALHMESRQADPFFYKLSTLIRWQELRNRRGQQRRWIRSAY